MTSPESSDAGRSVTGRSDTGTSAAGTSVTGTSVTGTSVTGRSVTGPAVPSAAGDFRRLGGATLVVLAGSGVAVLASLAVRMLLARLLSPAELGLLLLAVAAVSVAGGVASLGINVAASREVASSRLTVIE